MEKTLLQKLEPEIERKCNEIKLNKKLKLKHRINILIGTLILIVPSILYLLNINILYFLIVNIVIVSLIVFVNLPKILNGDLKEACYE